MGDKIRGALAILVGTLAIVQGGLRYLAGHTGWKPILEVVAGVVLIGIGAWRFRRSMIDPAEELLK